MMPAPGRHFPPPPDASTTTLAHLAWFITVDAALGLHARGHVVKIGIVLRDLLVERKQKLLAALELLRDGGALCLGGVGELPLQLRHLHVQVSHLLQLLRPFVPVRVRVCQRCSPASSLLWVRWSRARRGWS